VVHVRTVKTATGATAEQIVHSNHFGKRDIEHIGSAHTDAEIDVLKAVARQRMSAGQAELDLGLAPVGAAGQPAVVTSSRMARLWGAISQAFAALGLEAASGGDEVFRALVAARIIEPTSKLDSLRVIDEAGIKAPSYATVKRALPAYATESFRGKVSAALAKRAAVGPASLVLYDVTTLYFETDQADDLRIPGFSKERRLEPQIVVGLLTDANGFPLQVSAFEGNKAETHTMLPVIKQFMKAHRLTDVTVVADAGMVSDGNRKAIEAEGLSFIIGEKVGKTPSVVAEWRGKHPGKEIDDGRIFVQPWPAGPKDGRRDHVIYYQYRADRARRTLRGIDEQVKKAQAAIDGKASIKRNRFVKLTGGKRAINRELEVKARAVAGIKGYITNRLDLDPEQVIAAYHQLWHVEKAFRMSKHDLRARPIYHRKSESIDAHLTIVIAAMAVSHLIETETGWSIKKFVRAARRYRTMQVDIGGQTITAEDPIPPDLHDALTAITRAAGIAH
jgi:hypothetical protein